MLYNDRDTIITHEFHMKRCLGPQEINQCDSNENTPVILLYLFCFKCLGCSKHRGTRFQFSVNSYFDEVHAEDIIICFSFPIHFSLSLLLSKLDLVSNCFFLNSNIYFHFQIISDCELLFSRPSYFAT